MQRPRFFSHGKSKACKLSMSPQAVMFMICQNKVMRSKCLYEFCLPKFKVY